MSDPPFQPRGGCVPYAIATLLNKEGILDEYPAKDQEGNALSYDYFHASMMYASNIEDFAYFKVLVARSRRYNANGELKKPKQFVGFEEFSHSAVVYHISQIYKDKEATNFVFLFEVRVFKKTHCIGIVLDVKTGKAIVCDSLKDKIWHIDIGNVFRHYNVMSFAVLKFTHNRIPAYSSEFFAHLGDYKSERKADLRVD